jgi:hypothetical protein
VRLSALGEAPEQPDLQLEPLGRSFDDQVGLIDACERAAGLQASQRLVHDLRRDLAVRLLLAQPCLELAFGLAGLRLCLVGQRHAQPGTRDDLRDACAHLSGANDGDSLDGNGCRFGAHAARRLGPSGNMGA